MSFPPITIFFSYALAARKDKNLFDALRKHLIPLKRLVHIQEWYESELSPGADWQQVVDTYLNSADIIVLLISPDFFASEHCGAEMQRAVERGETELVRIISVLLRPLDLENFPFKNIGPLLPKGVPVSQWTDKDTALSEVAKGIRKVVEELSNHVIGTITRNSKTPIHKIPYRRNTLFMGREDLLALLHNYFTSEQDSRPLIQAVCGIGGIGKTQLAIEYAYRYRQEYHTIFWLRAASPDLFRADLIAFAEELSLPERERANEQQLFASIRRWLQSHSAWLLLIDDFEDFSLIDLLVPPQCAGHILLMTQSQATGTFAHALAIEPMTIDESALFLLRRAKIIAEHEARSAASPTDYRWATEIAQEVDGFPLVLDQAGAYIEETRRSLADYLVLYRQRRAKLLQRRGHVSEGHRQPVTITLSLAFEQVTQSNPAAMELLTLFAFLHPDAIPDEMIVQGASELDTPLQELATDPLALDDAIALLFDFSLVRRRADTTTLSIHRVVQAVLRDALTKEEQRHRAILVVHLVNAVFPYGNFDAWTLCRRYLPQAQQCAEYITDLQIEEYASAQLLHHLGFYCYNQALYSEAETYLTLALKLCEQVLGNGHIETAETLDDLGLLVYQLGDYQGAEALHKRSLVIYEEILGPEHPETAIILNNLALFYCEQGKYQEAEPLYQRALAIHESISEPEQTEIATLLNNLGLLYQKQGKYQKAETFYLRALILREKILAPEHIDFAESWNNLATLYQDQGKNQQAEPFLRRALELFEKTLGPRHPDTAIALNNLARLYSKQGNEQEAVTLALRALAIYEQTLGPEHPDIAQTLNNLGTFYRMQGNYQEAESSYLRALTIYTQGLGSEHPDIAQTLNNLGKLYQFQKDYQQAEPLFKQAITICENLFGLKHPDTALYLSNLAELYTLQGRYQEADMLYQQALMLYQQTLPPEHPSIGIALEKYATLCEHMQRTEEARALRQQAQSLQSENTSSAPDQSA